MPRGLWILHEKPVGATPDKRLIRAFKIILVYLDIQDNQRIKKEDRKHKVIIVPDCSHCIAIYILSWHIFKACQERLSQEHSWEENTRGK